MSNSRFPVMAVALVVIGLGQVATADTTPAEEEKIETLIRTIETLKDAVFMRNGREYESAQAADHLRTKWRFARSRIKTARAFIIHVAARSSRTGEPYLIRFADGREVTSDQFLEAELERLEAASGQPATRPTTQPATRPTTQPGATRGNAPAPGFDFEGSDSEAIRVADAVMRKMGGREAWERLRYLTWNFFGARRHVWDKHTGDVRIEGTTRETGEAYVVLMNLRTRHGRVWKEGRQVSGAELAGMLEGGEAAWINDSYWLVMPYKLKDSGVTLKYVGEGETEKGRAAEILELTFDRVGRTPQNKYHVYVGRETGLVEQWDFYRDKTDEKPAFKVPWRDWKRYGRIMISGDRGEMNGKAARLTDIAVFDELPASIFNSAEDIDWNQLIGD